MNKQRACGLIRLLIEQTKRRDDTIRQVVEALDGKALWADMDDILIIDEDTVEDGGAITDEQIEGFVDGLLASFSEFDDEFPEVQHGT